MYEAKGPGMAMLLLADEFDFDDKAVRDSLPYIMAEADERGISVTQFLQDYENAIRTIDNGGELPAVSSDEAGESEDAHVTASARDADGEDKE
jgi:hypothetical protein